MYLCTRATELESDKHENDKGKRVDQLVEKTCLWSIYRMKSAIAL
jgi:hypothetical protein